jgi:hypothetical protein
MPGVQTTIGSADRTCTVSLNSSHRPGSCVEGVIHPIEAGIIGHDVIEGDLGIGCLGIDDLFIPYGPAEYLVVLVKPPVDRIVDLVGRIGCSVTPDQEATEGLRRH